jgi:hypothetical protein
VNQFQPIKSATLAGLLRSKAMSFNHSRSSSQTRSVERGGPTLVQRPTQHEGLRRALASSFGLIDEDDDFQRLLMRLR